MALIPHLILTIVIRPWSVDLHVICILYLDAAAPIIYKAAQSNPQQLASSLFILSLHFQTEINHLAQPTVKTSILKDDEAQI